MKTLALFSALVLLAGCARVPTRAQIANADYGTFPDDYVELVKSYIDDTFNDPGSVKDLQVNEPAKYWYAIAPLQPGAGTFFGYKVEFRCNAKNEYGGYGGNKWTVLFVKNGEITDITQHIADHGE